MLAQAATPSGSRFSPLPFVLAGLAPFGVGTLLAGVSGFPVRRGVWVAGTVAIGALIKAAFASRQVFAPEARRGPAWGDLSPERARRQAYLALLVAALMGLLLQVWCRTGDLTIPLGSLGILGGYFYFAPPLQWHRRGMGETAGALCFGLLPVAAGLYLQCGHLLTEVLLYGLPLTFAGFNLFLIYGFPPPDAISEPHSLAARLGPLKGALIYTIVNILAVAGLMIILLFPAAPLPRRALIWPLLVLAVVNQELVKRKAYREESRLRLLGHLALTLHLGMGLVFILMLWPRL